MTHPLDTLRAGARRILGRDLSPRESAKMHNHLKLLMKWQRVQRLAGSDDPEWVVTHLLLDSLLFVRALPARVVAAAGGALLDFGSGAGVPGVPLAIVLPQTRVTLLESRQRRASFLAEVVRTLPLENCRVVAERAEAVDRSFVGAFDAVVIRCAGDPAKVVPIARKFVAEGGRIVLSGPPNPQAPTEGEWLEVDGVTPDTKRRFLTIST